MSDLLEESIRIYYSQADTDDQASSIRSGQHYHQHQDDAGGILPKLINSVLEDMKRMGQLHASLHETNGLVKVAQDAPTMTNLRNRLNADLHCLLELAKQINKKFDSLVAANAAQRGHTFGPSDERTRASIADLAENIKVMMRDFQGLRVQMEVDQRQVIENRYFAIKGEKATAEAIDRLIANRGGAGPGTDLYHAVAVIQVRRDTMIEVRTNLMCLHQIFVGISTPVDTGNQQQLTQRTSSLQKDMNAASFPRNANAAQHSFVSGPGMGMEAGMGTGGLNNYERETRKQAHIAIAVAIFVMFFVILALYYQEQMFETAGQDEMPPP